MTSLRRRLIDIDWHAVVGILAALIALVLHFLHIVEEDVLLMIAVVLMALLFFRDLQWEADIDDLAEEVARSRHGIEEIRSGLDADDIELIGPGELRRRSERFGRNARGEMIWFNVCLLMFVPQDLFDTLLKPAIENPDVDAIRFVLDESERERWQKEVKPKVDGCASSDTVCEPVWQDLTENVSFILRGTEDDGTDALLSFWGEPFMARTSQDVPRYIIHVTEHSELIPQLQDIERDHRLQGR